MAELTFDVVELGLSNAVRARMRDLVDQGEPIAIAAERTVRELKTVLQWDQPWAKVERRILRWAGFRLAADAAIGDARRRLTLSRPRASRRVRSRARRGPPSQADDDSPSPSDVGAPA